VSGPRAPVPGARLAIATAVRTLPRPARERYYCEFVAELYGMPASAQFRHAAGVVAQTTALRAALGGSSSRTEEVPMTTTTGQRFRCRYLHWHHWAPVSTPDGERYIACAVCRKDHGGWAGTNPNMGAGIAGGG
jgi:hypothetical protein